MTLDVRGKTVVLTGTFSKLKRAEAEAGLVALGAKIGSGVNKSTHLLFAGEKAGSKINAASKLGVTVLGETELMAALAGGGEASGKKGAKRGAKKGAREAQVTPAFDLSGLDPQAAGAKLAKAIEALAWDEFDVDRDLPGLRELLYAHERAQGVTAAHRAATVHLRPRALLRHGHGHDVEVSWVDLSPDGRFLATGSWVGDDYHRGGVLQIWDVRAGRCVNILRIGGGVGWPDHAGCVQWRPDGRRVGLAYDTNGVGSFDPFGKSGEPDSCAYITDGWNRPPAWTWAPNSRDVYIACWGPELALGAIVPLIGRRPEPRWCAPAGRVDAKDPDSEPRLEPLHDATWAHRSASSAAAAGGSTRSTRAAGRSRGSRLRRRRSRSHRTARSLRCTPRASCITRRGRGCRPARCRCTSAPNRCCGRATGARLAAVVQPGNRWGAEPGIFIYDRGDYRYSPDAPMPGEDETLHVAWSPDGRKIAVTVAGRLQIWELGEAATLRLDIAAPAGSGVSYGDGVLIAWSSFGLAFHRDSDGAVIGAFKPAVEASGESPIGDELGSAWDFDPAFPLDAVRVAAALPEGVVIGPEDASASVEEVDGKIAWVIDRKWAWPWRWGEAKIWPDARAACADPEAPAILKRQFGKRSKVATRAAKTAWPPVGGSLDDIAGLLKSGIVGLGDGYHANDYRRKYAVRTMALGMFERAAAALDGEDGWSAWSDPWFAAYAHGETVMTALAGRVAGAPALTREQTASLKRWLTAAEALLKKKAAKETPQCRPLAVLGASWILLGDAARGEKALATAIATIDPENNSTEHRRVVAEALAAVGRIRDAITHLTSAEGKPSWTETPAAFAAIVPRASVAELTYLLQRLQAVDGHNEFSLLDRGLARLIELKAWDAALAWVPAFDGLSTREAELRLAAAMAAAGEAARAEAAFAKQLEPGHAECADFLLGLARSVPERARLRLEAIVAGAAGQLASRHHVGSFLANLGAAAAVLGRLDVAARVEALAPDASEKFAVRVAVLTELAVNDPAWLTWFTRARAELPRDRDAAVILAAVAHRGGQSEASTELLDKAIEAARAASSADLALQDVSGHIARAGDLVGAHRAWQAISKGRRADRNGSLMDACVAREQWAAVLDLLRQMPMDLNGAPKRASKILLTVAGGEGW
ncbi:MAG: hypothetical protein IPJ59_17935 [Nannocystis sp.]|nr:BRCT domain-containing protein [Nannocystis sp.]MBK7827069.1 hypothetical protein [Nannocystis sp.]